MFKQQPHLKTNSSGGACHVVYGNWKGSEKIAGKYILLSLFCDEIVSHF